MSSPAHLLIRASAGTGKTFRLTHRFIALLAQDQRPDTVLASTFTRRAAGEILRRLVARLAEAATSAEERAKVNEQLALEPGGVELDEGRARRLLLDVVRQLQRVEVRTMDAFFHQLARVHAWELDLPPGWTLATPAEIARLRSDAVTRVLARPDRGELLALLAALAGGAPGHSVHKDLLDAVKAARDVLLDSQPAAWTAIGPPPALPAADIERAAATLRDEPAPLTKAGKPDSYWVNSLSAANAALAAGDAEAFRKAGVVKGVANGEMKFSRHDIPAHLADAIRILLQAEAARDIVRAAHQLGAWHRLLLHYDTAFVDLQRERRLLEFADVPRALLRGDVPSGSETTLALRLDGPLRHVLLDEFQDTSTVQWQVLAPLLDRTLADPARHVFVVGDRKQSIFGWRQGEPRLTDVLESRGLVPERLDLSRRSAPAIIDTVNDVFTSLDTSPALGDDPAMLVAAREWHGAKAFPRHETAKKDLSGAARLWRVPMPDKAHVGVRRARLAEATASLVAGLRAADPRATVGVLVRTNNPIPRLILALRACGVLASGEGGNTLTDSEPVHVLLSLLRLADHPGDSAAAFHVGTSPIGPALGIDPRPGALLSQLAASVRAELLRDGYGPFLQARREQLEATGTLSAWDRRRVAQLVDLGHAWDARASLRPADFVHHVRHTKVEDPSASHVRVLTVHAAKGLEFDAVVCPDLETNPLRARSEATLAAERADPERPVSALFLGMPADLARQAGHAPLARLLDGVRQRGLREELCVLYVALTRAKRRLDLLVSATAPPDASFAAILRHALTSSDPASSEQPVVLGGRCNGEADPLLCVQLAARPETDASADAAAPAAVVAAPPIAWRAGGARHVLRRSAPSAREGGGRTLGRDLLLHDGSDARRRGSVIHDWLAAVRWLDEAVPDDALLMEQARRRLLRAGVRPDDLPLAEWLAWLRAALQRPAAQGLLTRAAAAGRLGVPTGAVPVLWCERPFLVVEAQSEGEEVLVPGAFDRVLLFRDAATRPLAAEILDFKTDRVGTPAAPDAAALAARTAHYAPQMQAYRRALARLVPGLPPAAIACRLLFLEADAVRDVAG